MECRACIRSPALSYAPCVLAHDGDGWNWFAAAINTRTGRAIAWDRLAGPDLSPLLLVDGIDFNAGQQSTCRAQNRVSVSQALGRIRKVARERKKERFTMLFHHLSIGLLEEAFFELKEVTCPRDFGALITSETGSRFGGSNARSAFHGRADGRGHPRGGS